MPNKTVSLSASQASRPHRITKPSTTRRRAYLRALSKLRKDEPARGQHHSLPSPQSDISGRGRKRKREGEAENSKAEESPCKHRRPSDSTSPAGDCISEISQSALVEHWRSNNHEWSDLLEKTETMGDRRPSRPVKRSLSRSDSQSYRQSTLSGNSPKAWTRKHGQDMENAGIFMDEREGVAIIKQCEQLCNTIQQAEYPLPEDWSFQQRNFRKILEQVRYRNEQRVMRDVNPLVMPSPETLHAQGLPGLENIAEGLNAEWTKCTSLCGPKSKPDATHGLSRFVFTTEEREKLTLNNTCACEDMFFPFYICEAKSIERSIEEAELQAMHNASVAVNAVVELYQNIGAAYELHRRVLAFSISHNHHVVKVHAHFPWVDCGSVTFHRRLLFETDLASSTSDWTRPYQITLGVWEHFYPEHLRRIQDALSRQRGRAMESFTAQLGLDEDAASTVSTPPSSQEDSYSKRPSLLSTAKVEEENERLRNQLLNLTQQLQTQVGRQQEDACKQQERMEERMEQQKEESRKQQERMERQMEQQKEESRKQQERMERQMEQQKEESRKQQERMERQMEQQKEESRKQQERVERQMEQQQELISLLEKSTRSSNRVM